MVQYSVFSKIRATGETPPVARPGTGACYHCADSPLLLTTLFKSFGTEESTCFSCDVMPNILPFWLDRLLLCRIFHFKMCQTFLLVDQSGIQAGHFNTWTLLL